MDEADYAQAKQELYLDIALKERRGNHGDDDLLVVDGKRRCVDCERIIPRARLKANPLAVRCVGCQASKEKTESR